MKKIVLATALVFLSSVAFAKSGGSPTPQNHSCMLNAAVVQKTKKECIKAGGKWEKNSPAADSKPAESKPADSKPVDTKPAKSKPAKSKPAK